MSPLLSLASLGALAFLSFANGANDNGKGVATLVGSKTLDGRRALLLALVATLGGSLAAAAWGGALLRTFGGVGLVPDAVAGEPRFLLCVAFAAAGAVLLATRLGLPVSTTHALLGGLLGAGLVLARGAVSVPSLGRSFVLPLLVSPLLACACVWLFFAAARLFAGAPAPSVDPCVCVEASPPPAGVAGAERAFAASATLRVGTAETCTVGRRPLTLALVLPLSRWRAALFRNLHLLSAGAVSFARGLNDTPKIAAIGVAAAGLGSGSACWVAAAAMAFGGWIAARRVARTMSFEIARIDEKGGLAANLASAALVLGASRFGLAVSTTHVTCGAIFGMGAREGELRTKMLARILLAWVTTLPLAAALSAGLAAILDASR